MKKQIIMLLCLNLLLWGCGAQLKEEEPLIDNIEGSTHIIPENIEAKMLEINEAGTTVEERFLLPEGFSRVEIEEGSFQQYLRGLGLKPHGSKVLYFDGREKNKENVYAAVVDMEIGSRDLQQCADAIIRLRAEYFYGRGEYDKIHFNFTNGFRVDYTKWMEGYRIAVDGNNTSWVKRTEASSSYESFRKYLDIVFAYAGTISLEKELETVELADMEIGDVFIQGGSPGHAVIVVDMAENKETGERIFMLAQSYMPAQEIQILHNPENESISPWYSISFGDTLKTPEWTFDSSALKGFE